MSDLTLGSQGAPLLLDADHLTTHGVIVGMTGSGKTGLAIVMLEELRRRGVPLLILDPKGDMTNLCLTFPEFRSEDFAPWCGEQDPAAVATMWKDGLAKNGIDSDAMRAAMDASGLRIYTPGSTAGIPLALLGSLKPPADWNAVAEEARAEISALVSGVLGLADIDADPLSSPEHILLANLIEHQWRLGQATALADLIPMILEPPLRKLGVLKLDDFYPKSERTKLAMRLNGVLAAPGFSTWLEGAPLDIQSILYANKRPMTSIVYLAHLSEAERQMVVSTILGKMTTWMRGQSGSDALRACIYMDEVFGYVPPSKSPPAKQPILTILKQARAFGVGMVLSTQNPVDLDYKAMSNAGLWFIGRLQTERDKARIVEGLESASGGTDTKALDASISNLGKREFICHNVRKSAPSTFSTRWAMSYLAGPLAKSQLGKLPNCETSTPTAAAPAQAPATSAPAATATSTPAPNSDATTARPDVNDYVKVGFLSPSAPWRSKVDIPAPGASLAAGLACRVALRFDERKADLDHREEYELIYYPLPAHFKASAGVAVDYDERDFLDTPPQDATYLLPEANIATKGYFTEAESDIKQHLIGNLSKTIFANKELKLFSRIDESEDSFAQRCDRAAQEQADEETAKLRDKIEAKLARLGRQLEAAESRVEQAEAAHSARKTNELVSGAGSILGALLGGKMNSRAIAKRSASKIGGLASRRGQTATSAKRVDAAKDKVAAKADEILELESELEQEIIDIDQKWADAAADIETLEVGLERDDVSIESLTAFWA